MHTEQLGFNMNTVDAPAEDMDKYVRKRAVWSGPLAVSAAVVANPGLLAKWLRAHSEHRAIEAEAKTLVTGAPRDMY
jgi:hypothetical protein